jgi:hypothetical protein
MKDTYLFIIYLLPPLYDVFISAELGGHLQLRVGGTYLLVRC